MKTTQKVIVGFLAISATFFGVAYAKGGSGCDYDGSMRNEMMRDGRAGRMSTERLEQRMNQRQERLHSTLKITAQQEPLWQAYAEKSKAEMGKGVQSMQDSSNAKLTAPERMEKMQTNLKERVAAMEGVSQSFKNLYDALSPEQKAIADTYFSRFGQGKSRRTKGAGPQAPAAASSKG